MHEIYIFDTKRTNALALTLRNIISFAKIMLNVAKQGFLCI